MNGRKPTRQQSLRSAHLRRSTQKQVRHTKLDTEIIIGSDEIEATGPYCVLPPNFFEYALMNLRRKRERTLLQVSTWDGRSVMEVANKPV